MIEVDGGYLEGGGQILRTACAMAAITQKPCHVFNIRKSRPKPGLAPQHLLGIQSLSQLCNGKLEGDYLGSEKITFYPGKISAKDINLKIETAASITLCLQSILPVSFLASASFKILFEGGGTDVPFSPTTDYFHYVFLRILEMVGAKTKLEVLKRGYFPTGKGKIAINIFPSTIKPINLIERGSLQKILFLSGASNSLKEKKVAERQIAGAREILGKLKLPIEERVEYYDTDCPGNQICLAAEFENTVIGVDNLGKLSKRAEDIGKEVALNLLKEQKSGACLDKRLADQILIYLALSSGQSQVSVSEITNHTKTNIWLIEKFLNGRFEIKENIIKWLPNL